MRTSTLYAVDMAGTPVAILELAQGADFLEAELFVLRGNVKGAHRVAYLPTVETVQESQSRIDDALHGIIHPSSGPAPKREERKPIYHGTIEESDARIANAIGAMDGRAGASGRQLSMPVYRVTPQKPREDLKASHASNRISHTPITETVPLRETTQPSVTIRKSNGQVATFRIQTTKGGNS